MKTLIKLFKELLFRFPRHFILLFFMVLLQVIFNTLSVVAVAPMADFLFNYERNSVITEYFISLTSSIGFELNLLHVMVFYAFVILLVAIFSIVVNYTVYLTKFDVLILMLTNTLGSFFRARLLFFTQADMGVLLNTFQQEVSKIGNAFGAITMVLANIVQVFIFLAVPFILSPKLTVIFMSSILIISAPLWLFHSLTYGLGKKSTETSNKAVGILHETLTSAKLIIGFGRQSYTVRRFRDAFARHAKVHVKLETLNSGIPQFFQPIGIIAVLVAAYFAYSENVPLSEMAMILFAFTRLMPILGTLIGGKASIERFLPAYEQLNDLTNKAKALEESQGNTKFNRLKNGIIFDNVSFGYPDRKLALRGISIAIPKGKMIAIVGKSGAGKTTLVDLMLGLYNHSSGNILINGKKIDVYDLNTYRNKIGYVPQDPQLFDTSIRENLLWSAPEAKEKDLWHACRMANAEGFVDELPSKLETILGDRGVRLSGGQRQRLALARALIRKPELLILDEATSALDTESERLIQQAIDKLAGKMTIVVIAHRLSTIQNAEYVYVLEAGKVVEEGSYRQLSKKSNGKLYKMIIEQVI